MRKFKTLNKAVALLAIVFLFALFLGNAPVSVHAEDGVETPVETVVPPTDEGTGGAWNGLVDGFRAQLKEKFGEEYETYYNAIISEWGSLEAYFLDVSDYVFSLAEEGKIPDEAASGWTSFVNWLGEYSPIWGSILAVALVITVSLFGKKALRKVAVWVTGNSKNFKNLYNAFNTLYLSTKAQNEALIKLLGENERFKEEREALKKATEEIEKDAEV